jgi:hypothetical protein
MFYLSHTENKNSLQYKIYNVTGKYIYVRAIVLDYGLRKNYTWMWSCPFFSRNNTIVVFIFTIKTWKHGFQIIICRVMISLYCLCTVMLQKWLLLSVLNGSQIQIICNICIITFAGKRTLGIINQHVM